MPSSSPRARLYNSALGDLPAQVRVEVTSMLRRSGAVVSAATVTGVMYLACPGGPVVAAAAYRVVRSQFWLYAAYVRSGHRRRGYYRELVARRMTLATGLGARSVLSVCRTSNSAVLNALLPRGFRITRFVADRASGRPSEKPGWYYLAFYGEHHVTGTGQTRK